jgi:hypothetical protein
MTPDPNYTEKIGFMTRPNLKKALEDYSQGEGVKPGLVCRKAIFEFLVKKGALKESDKKDYL